MHAVAIPEPGDWEWRHSQRPHHASLDDVELTVSDNPVVATLLGPDGKPIRQWRERPPFGYVGSPPRDVEVC